MRTLLINLTRFGDLLQSQPLVTELTDSGHTVGVVCLDNFASAAALLRGVDAIYPLPGGKLLANLDQDWRHALVNTHAFTRQTRTNFNPECVINLTSTPAGRLLTRHLGEGLPTRGFGLDALGFGANGTVWTSFFEAASRRRGCSPFNIVDVFRKAAGLGNSRARNALREPDPEAVQALVEQPELGKALKSGRLIALQLGASEPRRQWPVEYFAAVACGLIQAGYTPVLVGSTQERPLADACLAASLAACPPQSADASPAPLLDMTGNTTLPQLAALLAHCKLLITNDTGTMHLAAGLGTPCVALFLATAQPWDTGPYLADCLCLEPDMPCHPCGFGTQCPHNEACRMRILPETVLALALSRLKGEYFAAPVVLSKEGTARIWHSRWEPDGFMNLYSLSGHENSPRTVWLRLQRHFYRQYLDLCDSQPAQSLLPSAPALAPAHFVGPSEMAPLPEDIRTPLLRVLEQAGGLLLLIEQTGALLLSGAGGPQLGQRFLGAVHRLTALLEEPAPLGGFDALGRLWFTVTQERGEDLAAVLRVVALLRHCLTAWAATLNGTIFAEKNMEA